MQSSLFIRVAAAILAFGVLAARAEVYKPGDSVVGFTAPDQHGRKFTFKAGDARFILFDTPAPTGETQPQPDPDSFARNRALLVINISALNFVKREVAQSRMASKPFRMLVVDDKGVAARFPVQDGKITVLLVDETGGISSIAFAARGKEMQALISGNK